MLPLYCVALRSSSKGFWEWKGRECVSAEQGSDFLSWDHEVQIPGRRPRFDGIFRAWDGVLEFKYNAPICMKAAIWKALALLLPSSSHLSPFHPRFAGIDGL